MNKKIIVIASPSTGWYNFEAVAALLSLQIPEGYQFMFNFISNCLIYDAREKLVEYAQSVNADYIFFLDSDMVPPSDTIQSLVAHDKDIISGMIFRRKYPFQPCFYMKCDLTKTNEPIFEGPMEPEKWPKSGAFEFEGFGLACCLIKMDVFDNIKKPYFFPRPNVGEDLTFCLKAKKAGYKMWVDFGVDCAHMGNFPVIKESYQNSLTSWLQDPANKGKLIFGGEE
jgi:GT2 family glycosyltransferase